MVQAKWNGAVIAESGDTVIVEGNHYFPRDSVWSKYLLHSDATSHCPWKGDACYHSLIVDEDTLPDFLVATARTEQGELMAVRHRDRPVHGVQFHPESILSEHGHRVLATFLGVGAAQAEQLDAALQG